MADIEKMAELHPIHDARQSFYGKATVMTKGDVDTLYSYNTKIISVNNKTGKVVEEPDYQKSQTTSRHRKEFLLQHNVDPKKSYVEEKESVVGKMNKEKEKSTKTPKKSVSAKKKSTISR